MRFLKLTIAYNGENYIGWQFQPNGPSVQQCLETAWKSITDESIRFTASGRTDAGVHAEAQVCSVQTNSLLDNATLVRALNARTPIDIAVLNVETAPQGFHAIRDATQKTYRYQIQFGKLPNVIGRSQRWYVPNTLDVEAMRAAAKFLIGQHDFASFQAAGSRRFTTIRNLSCLEIREWSESIYRYIDIEMTCDGFLYNMVRNIVGTMVVVGQGTQKPEWAQWVMKQKHRRHAGPTAPGKALFLVQVEYDLVFA